jgi:hypothetical protein
MLQVCWRSTTFPNCIWSWVKTTSSAVDANTLFKSAGFYYAGGGATSVPYQW